MFILKKKNISILMMRKIGPSWPGCKNQKRCLCVLTNIRGQDCYLRTDALTVQPVCDVPTWFCPSFSFPPFLQKIHGACTQISFHQTFKEASTLVDPSQFWVCYKHFKPHNFLGRLMLWYRSNVPNPYSFLLLALKIWLWLGFSLSLSFLWFTTRSVFNRTDRR